MKSQEEGSGSEVQFSAALQWRRWTAHDLAMILAASLQLPATETAPHFTLAFQYFDQVNHYTCTQLSLCKYHDDTVCMCPFSHRTILCSAFSSFMSSSLSTAVWSSA